MHALQSNHSQPQSLHQLCVPCGRGPTLSLKIYTLSTTYKNKRVNTEKQMQRARQNEETEEQIPNERIERNHSKGPKQKGDE